MCKVGDIMKHIYIDELLIRIYRKYSVEFIIGLYEDVSHDIESDKRVYLKRLMKIVEKLKSKNIQVYGHFNIGGFRLDFPDIQNSVCRVLADNLYEFVHLHGMICEDRNKR